MRCDHKRPNDRPINDACVNYIDQLIDELYNKIESLEKKLENISAKGYDDSELVAEIDQLKKLKADIQLLDKSFYTKTQSDSRFVTHKELMGYAQTSAHYTKRESDERYIDKYEILNYVPRCCYEHDQEEIKEIIDDINIKLNKLIELLDPTSEFLDILNHLDYDDIEVDNQYVSAVNQENGKISVIRKSFPAYEKEGTAETLVNSLAQGAVHKNTEDIAILNGDVNTEGSVKKAVSDAINEANLDQYAKTEDIGEIASYDTVPVSMIENFENAVKQIKVNAASESDKAISASCDEHGRSIHDTYAEKATTLEGYSITDAYTKTETSNQDAAVLAEAQRYADSLGSKYDQSGAANAVKAELTDIINGKIDEGEANKVEPSEANGNIKIDGVDTTVYTHPDKHTISEVTGLQDVLNDLQPKGNYAEKATTLAGYGITDAYTKDEASNQDAVVLAEAQQYTKELIGKLPEQVDYTVKITENTNDETVAKTYVFTQNNKEIGTIKLAKELVVTSGAVKEVTEADVPYTGAKVGDKYIELRIANQDAPIHVPAKDLVDIYTAKDDAAEIQIAISNSNEISATIVDGSITEQKLAEAVKNKWEEVGVAQSLVDKLENGQVTANKQAIDAINNDDTGILKQAKDYTDDLLINYATKEETANQDVVVLSAAEEYADSQDANLEARLIDLLDKKQPAGSYAPAEHIHSESEIDGLEDKIIQTRVNEAVKASQDSSGNNISETYAKKAKTLEGYGITDAYTKIETSNQDAVVLAEAQSYTDTAVATAKGLVDELAEGQVKTNTVAIAAINDPEEGILKQASEYVDNKLINYPTKEEAANQDVVVLSEAEAYADRKDILIQEAKQAGLDASEALANYKVNNDQAVAKNREDLIILQGDSETEGSVTKQISDAITDLKLHETYEPLGAAQAALNDAALQDAVVLAEAQSYTDTKVSELVEGAVKTNTESIADLKANLDDCIHDVVPEDSSIKISDAGSTCKVSVSISKNVENTLSVAEDGLLNLPIEYSIIRAVDSGDYAAIYHLTKNGENVGVAINIPRDIVVQSGSVVDDNIVLVLNDANSTEIKIPVDSLIEYVTSGSQTTDPVVIHISDDHKVSATLTDGSITFTKLDTDTQNRVVTIEDSIADIYTKISDSTKNHLYLHSVFVSYKHTKTTGDGQFQFSTILINADSRPYTLTHNNGGSDWVQIDQEDAYDLYRFWKAVSQCQLNADGYPISTKQYPYMANGCLSVNFKTPLSIVQTIKAKLFKYPEDGTWRRFLVVNGSGMNSTTLGSSTIEVSCGTPTMNANGQDIADIADATDIPTSDLENYVGQDFYIVDTVSKLF